MSYAYTTSGSIKKYESNQWSIYWKGNMGTCTGPNISTGEYTITAPDGMSITSTKNDTSYCLTIYAGITNWFYFESKTIYINCSISLTIDRNNNATATCYRSPNTTNPNHLEYQFLKANKVWVQSEWTYNEGGYLEFGDGVSFILDPDNATLTQSVQLSRNKSYIQRTFLTKLGTIKDPEYITKKTGTWTYNGVTYKYRINC